MKKKIRMILKDIEKEHNIIRLKWDNPNSKKQKQITYFINKEGCHICNSHKCKDNLYPQARRFGKSSAIYRFVYLQTKGKISKNLEIRHTCDNTKCINPKHLILGTHKQNMEDMAKRNKRDTFNVKGCKLNKDKVLKIFNSSPKIRDYQLAKEFGVSQRHIAAIRSGIKCTKHTKSRKISRILKGENNPLSKLKNNDAIKIFKSNKTQEKLAKEFNVSDTCIYNIKKGITYKTILKDCGLI